MTTIQQELDRGWAIHQRGDYRTAETCYRRVLNSQPHVAAAWCFLGISLHDQKRYVESAAAYRESLRLQPHFPIAWNNLGNTLRFLRRVDDAEQAFDKALEQQPGYVNAWKNRGTLRMWEGNIPGALTAYAEAMQLAPQDAELHRNLGVINLLQGNFELGWEEYRWRWRTPGFVRVGSPETVWDGSDPTGKRILLYPEQGLGDTLHFVRMVGELHRRGARVILQTPSVLLAVLQSVKGYEQLVPQDLPLPPFDLHCSLIDAADRLRAGVNGFPTVVPYMFAAPHLVSYWKPWVDSLPGKLKVGICWQGNPDHQADHVRSIPLAAFASLAAIPNVTLISLQQGFGSEQLSQVNFGPQVQRLPDNFDKTGGAFMDTAAIAQHLDVVVTSDTSIAHLVGGLGRPVWVPLATIPDWRWLLNGESSPWYPTMRLFRQTSAGDWPPVLQHIAQELSKQCMK